MVPVSIYNPIEILWREIKRAIAGRYFRDYDKMHGVIHSLIKSGEVATASLFKYMLDAIQEGRKNTLSAVAT
ncbi:MAG: hypothetical protein F4Y51_04545 [Cenarchaeum sp. SB0664_bin_35]|nr:hypothetical protein [Cenarchaeum sp. SB0664_bin_35]